MTQSNVRWDRFGGLAEKLQVAENCINDQFVGQELRLIETFAVANHLGAEALQILEEQRPVPRRADLRKAQPPQAQFARAAQHASRCESQGQRESSGGLQARA